MPSLVCRILLLAGFALGISTVGLAQPMEQSGGASEQKAEDSSKKSTSDMIAPSPSASKKGESDKQGSLPLPPNSILAIYDNLADALKRMPRAVVLTPEKYQALLDQIARLEKQLEKPRLRTPSRCSLKGKIEGNLVLFSAQFEFETQQPGETVRLGCGLAQATSVSLDGRTPRLRGAGEREKKLGEEEGFLVEVETPGEHQLILEFVLATTTRPPGQGFTLDLPRAAITSLNLELPTGSREVRLGSKPIAETLLTLKRSQLTGSLGATDKLELSWKPAQAATSTPIVMAEGTIQVRLEDNQLSTVARLELRVQGGQVRHWRLLVPQKADIKLSAADQDRVTRIEAVDQKQVSLRTIHMKDPSSESLNLTITHTQPAPRPGSGKSMSIGPFSVVGAAKQFGGVLVSNSISDLHLEFTAHADLTRRAAKEEELQRDSNLVAAFRYGPGTLGQGASAGPNRSINQGWLEIETETVRGQIKVKPSYLVSLNTTESPPRWQVVTTFTVTPRWADIDRFVVQLPAGGEFVQQGSYPLPDRVMNFAEPDRTARTVEFRLKRGSGTDTALTPFAIRVETSHLPVMDAKKPGRLALALPRAPGTIEQEGTITIKAPDDLEISLPEEGTYPGLELLRQSIHEIHFRCPRQAPDKIDFAWKPYRSPVDVSSLADVALTPSEVSVQQQLNYKLIRGSEQRLLLDIPSVVPASQLLIKGGKVISLSGTSERSRQAVLTLADPRVPVVTLNYRYPLPTNPPAIGDSRDLALPLIVPLQTTQGESKVRVWSDPGELPRPSKGWTERGIEVVAGENRLPVLVVHSDRVDRPFALRMAAGEATSPALLEGILARVDVSPAGQIYHVSYRLARLLTRQLELDLPAPATSLKLEVHLDGRRVDYETDRIGKRVRLRVAPELVTRLTILDVRYRLEPDRIASTTLSMPLVPPRLVGDTGSVPTRWMVMAPPGWVVLFPEASAGVSRQWDWRGWLLAPRLNLTSADLERWITGKEPSADIPVVTPSLVFWGQGANPVQIVHVPQQVWLLSCSLLLVLLGMLAGRLFLLRDLQGRLPARSWIGLLLMGTLILVPLLLWPALAAQIAYGSQAGAIVLVILLLVQWFLHERHRRQVIFLSSFSRPRPGSSISRSVPVERPSRPPIEPSTVDVPQPVGSSINRTQ